MPVKSFLTKDEVEKAKILLNPADLVGVTKFLDQMLLERLSKDPLWPKTRPFALGSWARGELCAKSDIDLIFFGPDEIVKEYVDKFLAQGIKIRYRIPADRDDWTVGVLPFDVLALFSARSFFADDQIVLEQQIAKIEARGLKYKNQLFKSMLKERKERELRYDSISNYLEPNLKFGPGGLRDLEQGLMIYNLYKNEKFSGPPMNIERLQKLKSYLLLMRHWLHLNGGGDILTGSVQPDVARFLNYSDVQQMMTKVQDRLSEVSFYTDWIADFVQRPKAKIDKMRKIEIQNISTAFDFLKKDSSPTAQEFARKQRKIIKNKKLEDFSVARFLNVNMSDIFLQALFRSHLLEEVITPLKRLRGHVQHDQYHRYSVDAHTLQAVREVLRVKKRPNRLGRLAKWAKNLSEKEWDILFWTALYHDLGKGLKGDHSQEGMTIVQQDFHKLKLSDSLTESVAWMVKNHLILSSAAFRQNPLSSSTWTELFKRGVQGPRIVLLTIFTAIDIKATNPDAWNEWKERLLHQLGEALLSPEAHLVKNLVVISDKLKIKLDKSFIENLDPMVLEGVSHNQLLKDFKQLKNSSKDLPPEVLKNRKKEIWIRFHSRQDRPGLFLSYTYQLHSLGLSVQQAFASTHETWGVYDWFKVKTTKPATALKNYLIKMQSDYGLDKTLSQINDLPIEFAVIELVSKDQELAVISFRGKDQRGALLAAAKAIYDAGLEIQAAKVHTWGRQIDDVFTVKSQEQGLQKLLGTAI